MRLRKAILSTLLLIVVFFKCFAQAPTRYSQAKALLVNEDITNETFTLVLQHTGNLPLNKDSLEWLAPHLISAAERLKGDSAAGASLFKMKAFENLSILYSNYYADHIIALKYSSKELAYFDQNNLEEKGYGYMYTGALARRMFLLAELDEVEKSLQLAQQVQNRVERESDSLQRSFGYRQLCVFYHQINDFERGLNLCKSGLEDALLSEVPNFLGSFYETLALLLENEGNVSLDSIIKLRKKAIKYSSEYAPAFNRVNYRNLGINYLNRHQPDSAENYIEKSLQLFSEYPWEEGERFSKIWLARIYLHQGKIKESLQLANAIQPRIGKQDYAAQELNLLNIALAEAYDQDILSAIEKLEQRDSIVGIDFSEERQALKEEYAAKYKTAQKESENKILKVRAKRLQITFFLGAVVLVSALVILILITRQSKRKKRLAEKETQLSELKAEKENSLRLKAEEELERKKTELREAINQGMAYQSRNLELMELAEDFYADTDNLLAEKKARQLHIKLKELSREDALANIEVKAQQAYPKLYTYLQSSLPANSNTELLYCVLIVMDYSQDDIARSMQRTPKAIKSLRYRVRKRFSLSKDQDLKQYLLTQTSGMSKNIMP